VDELAGLVRQAAAANQAIYPVGGGTMLDAGLPPARPGRAVDLRQLTKVIDYPARDMTMTVQAGITISRLQEQLAAENQRLPIDVPQPDRATLGGALAVNVSGPRRYGFGTWRDYIIGLSAVNDEGQEIKAGGRVVKNVAGYDLCKLYIGSLGTLGVITQVTLKLKPRPEEQALVTLAGPADDLEQLLDRLHASQTRPVCLDLLNPAATAYINQQPSTNLPENGWTVVVSYEENTAAVAWQIGQLLREVGAGWTAVTRVGAEAEPLWRALAEFPLAPEAVLTFRANLLPHAVARFCRLADGLPERPRLQAHAGNGIITGHVVGDLTAGRAREMLEGLTAAAQAAQGRVVLPRCPTAWKPALPVWGPAGGDWDLMRAVKEKLDPRRLFNPGRFLPGL
jgi:glycolate oxidase FAD binding subunit